MAFATYEWLRLVAWILVVLGEKTSIALAILVVKIAASTTFYQLVNIASLVYLSKMFKIDILNFCNRSRMYLASIYHV